MNRYLQRYHELNLELEIAEGIRSHIEKSGAKWLLVRADRNIQRLQFIQLWCLAQSEKSEADKPRVLVMSNFE